jgi:hypothetical protein
MSQIPDHYGRTELVLMVVDPYVLFAYWDVTQESLWHAQGSLGAEMDGARAVIRMYDISLINFNGTNAHHQFDIDIGLEARAWYFSVWKPDKSYCADLGFVARTGRFHAITRSNIIQTPRAGVSPNTEERWMRVHFTRRRKPDPKRPIEYLSGDDLFRGLSESEAQALRLRLARGMRDSVGDFTAGPLPTSQRTGG